MRFKKVSYEQYLKSRNNKNNLEKTYDDIKLPKRATPGSAGYDFFAPNDIVIPANGSLTFPTGIRWIVNEDSLQLGTRFHYVWVLNLYPRSGLGFKHGIRLANTVGVIDCDYCNSENEGHIMVKLVNPSDDMIIIPKGDSFMQGIITKAYRTENEETPTEIRNGGFGSTNK